MMTRHFGLPRPLNSVREYFVGVFAASAIVLFSCCAASGLGLYGGACQSPQYAKMTLSLTHNVVRLFKLIHLSAIERARMIYA
jgi:hypothetical protein